jgi:hypothetical protein
MPTVGQTEENAAGASLATVVMGQASASAPSVPPTVGGAAPEEVALMERSAPLRTDAGPFQALVCVGDDLHMWGGPAL